MLGSPDNRIYRIELICKYLSLQERDLPWVRYPLERSVSEKINVTDVCYSSRVNFRYHSVVKKGKERFCHNSGVLQIVGQNWKMFSKDLKLISPFAQSKILLLPSLLSQYQRWLAVHHNLNGFPKENQC